MIVSSGQLDKLVDAYGLRPHQNVRPNPPLSKRQTQLVEQLKKFYRPALSEVHKARAAARAVHQHGGTAGYVEWLASQLGARNFDVLEAVTHPDEVLVVAWRASDMGLIDHPTPDTQEEESAA